jgi:hypothetical protein
MSIVLGAMLPASPRCTHVKGHSGVKSAQRQVQAGLATNRFVLRTDVKSYYASIDHVLLMDRLAQFIRDRTIRNLCRQYLIPSPIDQNPCAHWRSPMDMMRQGWSMSLFHASQQWSTRSS